MELGCNDGFLALKLLQGKHDVYSKSSMLREFLEVVNKGPLQSRQDLETTVEAWEAKISRLEIRYNRPNFLSEEIRLAIFLCILPKEYREKIYDRMATMPVDSAIDMNAEKEYIYAFHRERGSNKGSQEYHTNEITQGDGWVEDGVVCGWTRSKAIDPKLCILFSFSLFCGTSRCN